MRDLPIIFSAPMVCALLDGRKSMTRRIVKRGPLRVWLDSGFTLGYINDPGNASVLPFQLGDRLWVRESVQAIEREDGTDGVGYPADDGWLPIQNTVEAADRWGALFNYRGRGKGRVGNPVLSIHMPRWASRLTLTVTAVRVERLQEISEADAKAEGMHPEDDGWSLDGCSTFYAPSAVQTFALLWEDLHGHGAWDANPEVIVIGFDVRKGNIDA